MPANDFFDFESLGHEAFSFMKRCLPEISEDYGVSPRHHGHFLCEFDGEVWRVESFATLGSISSPSATFECTFHVELKSKAGGSHPLPGIMNAIIKLQNITFKAVKPFGFQAPKDESIDFTLELLPAADSRGPWSLSFSFYLSKRLTTTKYIILTFDYESTKSGDLKSSFAVRKRKATSVEARSRKSFPSVEVIIKELPKWVEQCMTKHAHLLTPQK
jgi:hypothetical protein